LAARPPYPRRDFATEAGGLPARLRLHGAFIRLM
jgi:hypothetical protein